MGNVVPTTRDEMIAFYQQHQPVWASSPTSIGLTSAQTLELANRLTATDFALTEAINARTVSRTATQTLDTAATDLRSYGSSLMSMIRGFAESTGDPAAIFAKAQIPPPGKPTPAGPPVPPTALTADPNATGTITLRWKGTLANGQVFAIERSVDGGPFVSLGAFGAKSWTDEAVPMNTNMIQYRVYGQRGLAKSIDPVAATVNFGNLPAALAAAFRSSTGKAAQKAA